MSRIVKLDIENVMRVKAVHIEPDGNVVVIGGRNAQGKTSVLDSISMAIGGTRLCPSVPIKDGEETGEIRLTLEGLSITRKFKRDGEGYTSSLSVKNAAGEPVARPQKTLDALIGKLAFDPLEFARMPPARARETLRELVGLDVEQLEEKLGNVYRKRTEAGVAKRAAQAVVDELPVPPAAEERVSAEAVADELRKAAESARLFEELKGERDSQLRGAADLQDRYARRFDALREAGARLKEIEALIEENTASQAKAQEAVEEYRPIDLDEIQSRLDIIMAQNQQADVIDRARERYQEKVDQAEEEAEAWKALDTEHNQIDNEIKKRTEAVAYPIEHLELRPEGVYYQGVPFDQGSRMERIKVSAAMGCAMNKELGILLIRDGSVLDDEAMTFLNAFADEKQMQFWIEMARGYDDKPGVVVIDDGGVV